MSKILVAYFTRTGTCKRISDKLLRELGECDIDVIKDNIHWKGILGFIKGGYMSLFKKTVPIQYEKDPSNYETVIVLTPIWAKSYPPAIRAYLEKEYPNMKNLILITNCDKTKPGTITNNIKLSDINFKRIYHIINRRNHENSMVYDIALEINK